MTQLFFPEYCCSMDQIAGDTPEDVDAFRRCNRLGPGQRLLPETFYVIPDDRPASHSIATQLNLLNPDQRRHLYDCAGQFGELTLAMAIFYDEQLSKIARRSTGLVGAGATAATVRMTAFESAVREYENALLALHAFERQGRGSGAERMRLRQAVELRHNELNRKFRVELERIVPRADMGKNRGTALTSSQRGLALVRRSKGRGLDVTDHIQAGRLVKFARAIRCVGNGAVVLDAGLRANDVHRTHQAGGDWMLEASVQLTGFGFAGALGGGFGKAAVVGGASLIAKMALTLTPAGWVVLIAGGIAVGFAAGYYGDQAGKNIASRIWKLSK